MTTRLVLRQGAPLVCRTARAGLPASPKAFLSKAALRTYYTDETGQRSGVLEQMKSIPSRNPAEWKSFTNRHIGPRDEDIDAMLAALGPNVRDLDDFIRHAIPESIMAPPADISSSGPLTEEESKAVFTNWGRLNENKISMIGGGYYPVDIPAVIKRNVLENPAWYTSYTPYQAEVSQGRLESLLNFQTMVSDLTGLPISNSSLLDEGTAAAEAMTMSMNNLLASRAKRPSKTYVISDTVHPSTISVMNGRAEGFGINLMVVDFKKKGALDKVKELGDDLVGVMVQYPDKTGSVYDYGELANLVHQQGCLLSVGTDLSALTLLKPPGEWGADIAFGNSQRFGVPLGFGGPHAAFMAVKESSKRRLPGRLIGVSKDRLGRPALRLALQTREQHIRREKATSNVCTAQALLANMSAMYAIYYGPEGLKGMAIENIKHARIVGQIARHYGFNTVTEALGDQSNGVMFDTISLSHRNLSHAELVHDQMMAEGIACGLDARKEYTTFAIPSNFSASDLLRLAKVFRDCAYENQKDPSDEVPLASWRRAQEQTPKEIIESIPEKLRRSSSYLTHPVFNSHHSETEMLRYIHHLASKDLSLVHSMIALGSCTMKLNGTTQMELIGNGQFSNIHPYLPLQRLPGYEKFLAAISVQLNKLTGMDDTCLQPNSGAQGEFAGLRVIRRFHETKKNEAKRDICLIPVSAHGTNPASAAMAGMRVVPIKCDTTTGNLDLVDLKAKCEKHADELGAIMITYPSTFGVFEPDVKKVCDMVHEYGGLVYMDGANMNAQIGLTSPGALGADVCHLNLHKTFCIPHGGGGPGVGPICVKSRLSKFLPGRSPDGDQVASARFGSASILPISWAYMATMGSKGLRKATTTALLNANYLLVQLKDHYPILYTNDKGRCAHEFIIDARPFAKTAGIEVIDIAKRLQDYGFHAPTMSWPVPNTLMIEPTESESKEELDRFVEAMISIREEIREIEEGRQPRTGNVLKNSPHPQADIVKGDGDGKWDRPYSREKAAYPLPWLMEKKFWPSVGRVDDAFGDTNLFCTCPPVEDTTGTKIIVEQ